MKPHSILSQSFPTLSSFRNLTKYACLSPMTINARKLLTEYSKINNHANLPERQLRSLQRQSKVNSLMTQEENNHLSMKHQGFIETSSWRVLPEEEPAHSSTSPVCSPRQQCFQAQGHNRIFFFFLFHLRVLMILFFMNFCTLPLSPLKLPHGCELHSFIHETGKKIGEVLALCLLFHIFFWQKRCRYLPFISLTRIQTLS